MDRQEFLRLVGEIVASSALVGSILYFVGQKWIETIFARKLAEHGFTINALFSRVSKIHDKEFEVLPATWMKLQDALGYVADVARPRQTYPDPKYLSDEELRIELENMRVRSWHVTNILSFRPEDRQDKFSRLVREHRIGEAQSKISEFHNYLLYNKIFLSDELYAQFTQVDELLTTIEGDLRYALEAEDSSTVLDSWKKLQGSTSPIVEEIERLIRNRLRYFEAD